MGGYDHVAFDTIGELRTNLRDRYKDCHAILKELLQNADDAGATELHIAWFPRLREAQHPLLDGPLLTIVNNASFTYQDSISIHLPGTGSKGLEGSRIGKFGLGLKSVFHLCESFFYVSDPEGDDEVVCDELRKHGRTGVLNPWKGERYSSWDSLAESDKVILRALNQAFLSQKSDPWFALCLPLRKEQHCRELHTDDPAEWAIEPHYYGEVNEPPEDVFSDRRIASLQQMLPLMSTLNRVRFWCASSEVDTKPRLLAEVVRKVDRHADWRTMSVGRKAIAGHIDRVCNNENLRQLYAGVQELMDHQVLNDLNNRSDWPWMDSQTRTGRKRARAEVKQHAAVVVMERPGKGTLHIDRAVFLPLGDPTQPECQSDGQHDIELMLHGYFFVDAGRLGVDFAPATEQPTVRQEWNRILYQDGTLPLVIPALAEYARTITCQQDSEAKLRIITNMLCRNQLWKNHQTHICRDSNWVFQLLPDRSEWREVRNNLPIIVLPAYGPSNAGLPFVVFPMLHNGSDGFVLASEEQPKLERPGSVRWPDGLATQMLRTVPVAEMAADSYKFDYLCECCRCLCDQDVIGDRSELRDMLRRAFRQTPLSELRKRKEALTKLVDLLPAAMRLPVPCNLRLVSESERVFEAMVTLDTDVLPIPDLFFQNDHTKTTNLGNADARRLLETVSKLSPSGAQEEGFYSLINQTFFAICSAWNPRPVDFVQECGDLLLFYAKNYKSDSRTKLAARELLVERDKMFVFATSATLCKELQACLPSSEILYLGSEIVRFLPPETLESINSCDVDGCAASLLREPPLLQDVAPRAELLRLLVSGWPSGPDSNFCKALRYLLHGRSDAPVPALILFVDGTGPWHALTRCILRSRNQSWRMISRELVSDIPESRAKRLELRQCGAAGVIALLQQSPQLQLNCAEIIGNKEWYEQIIREWPAASLRDLKGLPIFLQSNGDPTSITDQTFIKGDLPLPPASVFPNLILITDLSGAITARRLAPTLAPMQVLGKVLSLDGCHHHWRFILESIPDECPSELRDELRSSAWIPLSGDGALAPRDLICRKDLHEHVRRLRASGASLFHKNDLQAELRDHSKWRLVEALCAHGEHVYQILGAEVRKAATFFVGADTFRADSITSFVDLFTRGRDPDVMPAAGLIEHLIDKSPEKTKWIEKHLLPAMKSPLDAKRTRAVLQYLSAEHERAIGPTKKQLLEFFNSYLRESLGQPEFDSMLADMRFLNQENRWGPSSALALHGSNVADANLLHKSHRDVFEDAGFEVGDVGGVGSVELDRPIENRCFDPDELAKSSRVLGNYLQTWRSDEIPDDALAAVVAMLGDQDGFPVLYGRLQDTRPLNSMRNLFVWTKAVTGHWDLPGLMRMQHFCIRLAEAGIVHAMNLLGKPFEAGVNKKISTLFDGFDGRTYFPMPLDERCYLIRLRRIDPEGLSQEEKLEVLFNTLRDIRCIIHRQADDNLSTIWGLITQTGQLDIKIAQKMILESSAAILATQLSVRESERLKTIFKRWHQIRQQAETAKQTNNDAERREAEQQREETLEQLRNLLVADLATQELIIGEVRKRLEAASYEAASIPFELFQNADDSEVELETLCGDAELLKRVRPAELRHRFMVEAADVGDQSVLRFIHWGRGINQFRIGASDGSDRDFALDMERMLVLQGSGKDDSGASCGRTGRFGLGFKSVLFVCNEPRVLSGSRSRFKVMAGVYPEDLAEEDVRRIEGILEEAGDASHRGTVIELPLFDPANQVRSLDRFLELAGYLVVFARRIRRCSISPSRGRAFDCSWEPREILEGIECGEVHIDGANRQAVLVCRSGPDRYRAVLLPLNSRGFDSEATNGIPEIWVTGPTRHMSGGGLLVNGPFDLNPGRTQLRSTERNLEVAREMGSALGDQLLRIFRQSNDAWAAFSQMVGCESATADDFWSSLWDLCVQHLSADSESSVSYQILFGSEHCGLNRLIREANVIPSGLPGRYAVLTSIPRIRWKTSGILRRDEVWSSASDHPWICASIVPGDVIADVTSSLLSRFCDVRLKKLTLGEILRGAIGDAVSVEPNQAVELGKIIFPARLREVADDEAFEDDREEIEEVLQGIKFRTAAGGWSNAETLLISHDQNAREEEHRRALLAPDENIVSYEYKDLGLQFFLACRGKMQASIKQLIQWIGKATGDKRKAASVYLLMGDLRNEIQQESKQNPSIWAGTWLRDPEARKEAMQGMDKNDEAVLMGILGDIETFLKDHHDDNQQKEKQPKRTSREASVIFRDILAWWRKDRQEIIACHDRMRFPNGRPPLLSFSASQEQLKSDVNIRKPWLILLMLGAMHRIGRVKEEQNRGFLELCDERGWIDVLAGPDNDPSRWFKIMDEYLDSLQGEAKYYHWMNQFLAYYQLARWLPNYVRAFDAITRPGVNLKDLRSIQDIANLRTSHIFSGSTGFDAPPCARTMGLGAYFVLRETLRARAAQTTADFVIPPELGCMAFVPSRVVRRLFFQITGFQQFLDDSIPKEQCAKNIFECLRKHLGADATFDASFDISLLVLTRPKFTKEREQFLGSSGEWPEDDWDFLIEPDGEAGGQG